VACSDYNITEGRADHAVV